MLATCEHVRHVGEKAGCWLEQAKTTLFFLIHGTLAHDHQVVAVGESARPSAADLCAATPDVQQTRQTVSRSQEMSPPMPKILATALAAEHLPTRQPRMYVHLTKPCEAFGGEGEHTKTKKEYILKTGANPSNGSEAQVAGNQQNMRNRAKT